MKKYIGCDAHRRYSIFASLGEDGKWDPAARVEHNELEMERFLWQLPAGTPVALETSGNWYWLVRAMEEARLDPRLAHTLEAKKRMPGRNKTDHPDAKGLAMMLRNGSLPEVWIPPAKLLDLRDLMRTRLATRQQGSHLKCRILAALRRYGVRRYEEERDLFGQSRRPKLAVAIARLPQECRIATSEEWALLTQLEEHMSLTLWPGWPLLSLPFHPGPDRRSGHSPVLPYPRKLTPETIRRRMLKCIKGLKALGFRVTVSQRGQPADARRKLSRVRRCIRNIFAGASHGTYSINTRHPRDSWPDVVSIRNREATERTC